MSSTGEKIEFSVEKAVGEVSYVPWPPLLRALNIDLSKEADIANEGRGDPVESMSLLLRHWHNNYDSSWEALAKGLMSMPPFRRTGAYIYNKYVNPECLTAEKIVEELDFIEDWFELVHPFLDDSEKVREVVADTTDEEKKLKAMKYWLNEYYDVPSWDEVANVLDDCFSGREKARIKAEELREKYLPKVEFRQPGERKLPPLEEINSRNAFTETGDITDWYALGWFLGIPDNELVNIEKENFRTDGKRQAVLDFWFRMKDEKPSWRSLSTAIGKMRAYSGLSRRLLQRSAKEEKSDGIELHGGPRVEHITEVKVKTEETEDEGRSGDGERVSKQILAVEKVETIKTEHIGAVQGTVKRLVSDTESAQRIVSALENVKEELEQLKQMIPQTISTEPIEIEQRDDEEKDTIKIDHGLVPESILTSMPIISEIEESFSSDEDYSLDWSDYGCKLHIPAGSINEREEGSVKIMAIYSGSFELPKGMEFASAIYYISLSHDNLLKPATLSLQHCMRAVRNSEGECGLRFMYVPDTRQGLPYKFKPLSDGSFDMPNNNNYCVIQKHTFCFYAVGYIMEKFCSIIHYPIDYGLLQLLTAQSIKAWTLQLFLIKNLLPYRMYYQKQYRHAKEGFHKMELEKNAAVTIKVSNEKEGSPVYDWKGYALKIVSEWEIMTDEVVGDAIQLYPENGKSDVKISIDWVDEEKPIPVKGVFRLHVNGGKDKYNFPVAVPQSRYRSVAASSTGSDSSCINGGLLTDPPEKDAFIANVVDKISSSTGCEEFAVFLLNDETRTRFDQTLMSDSELRRNHRKGFMKLYDIWEREDGESQSFTWERIITALKDAKEMRLSKKLQSKYYDSLF